MVPVIAVWLMLSTCSDVNDDAIASGTVPVSSGESSSTSDVSAVSRDNCIGNCARMITHARVKTTALPFPIRRCCSSVSVTSVLAHKRT
jgi:hypothetical protein